jgi:hypothetical protein
MASAKVLDDGFGRQASAADNRLPAHDGRVANDFSFDGRRSSKCNAPIELPLLQVDCIFCDDFFVESGCPQHTHLGAFGARELTAIDVHLRSGTTHRDRVPRRPVVRLDLDRVGHASDGLHVAELVDLQGPPTG